MRRVLVAVAMGLALAGVGCGSTGRRRTTACEIHGPASAECARQHRTEAAIQRAVREGERP